METDLGWLAGVNMFWRQRRHTGMACGLWCENSRFSFFYLFTAFAQQCDLKMRYMVADIVCRFSHWWTGEGETSNRQEITPETSRLPCLAPFEFWNVKCEMSKCSWPAVLYPISCRQEIFPKERRCRRKFSTPTIFFLFLCTQMKKLITSLKI